MNCLASISTPSVRCHIGRRATLAATLAIGPIETNASWWFATRAFIAVVALLLFTGCANGPWCLLRPPGLAIQNVHQPVHVTKDAASLNPAPATPQPADKLYSSTPTRSLEPAAKSSRLATIIFARRAGLLAGKEIRYVIVRGTALDWDSVVEQRNTFPEKAGDFCVLGNITFFASPRIDSIAPSTAMASTGISVIIGRGKEPEPKPNACLLGTSRAGSYLQWQRPPGRMRLVVINPNGNETVAKPIEVKGGKTYQIELTYGYSAHFEVCVR